ncbi:MAG: STM4011 family radical SAM protein [Lysobacterales bacterium]|nr:STM4011 family radical SAM protein [Xanthomonadales bacterium]
MPPAERPATLSLLYRGTLTSCNYDCGYCPFAKRAESRDSLVRDRREVERFVHWCQTSPDTLELLFTPWGEALVRQHYRDAIVALSHASSVRAVGVQTNLSRSVDWLFKADVARVSLWCTFHPSQVRRERFLARCARLRQLGVRHSVGMVALREDIDEIIAMRRSLPAHTYLWLNAYDQREPDYYSTAQIKTLVAIDPHFAFQLAPQQSLGADCRAGASALSVDGSGNVRPCHFLDTRLGNLYDGSFSAHLQARPCTRASCECYIGYALRTDLPFVAPLLRDTAPRARLL